MARSVYVASVEGHTAKSVIALGVLEALKAKKFAAFRGWIAKMPALDASGVFRYFFDNLTNLFQPSTIPQVILILNQYQVYASQVVDQELNLTAAMIELAGIAEWK